MQVTAKTPKLRAVFRLCELASFFLFPLKVKPEVGTADRGDVASRLSQPQTLTLRLIFFAVTHLAKIRNLVTILRLLAPDCTTPTLLAIRKECPHREVRQRFR
jgi:hypothetical protein